MMTRVPSFALRVAFAAAGSVLMAGCASTGYVTEQIQASEQRQAAVDYAQNSQISQLDGKLVEALERVNTAIAAREPDAKLTTAAVGLIVSFGRNGTRISPDDQTRLSELAVMLLGSEDEFFIEIQGHTDSTGSARANAEVGARRAEAVRLFLHDKGIPLRRMSTISFSDTVPLVQGDDKTGQIGNRRAEIIVFK